PFNLEMIYVPGIVVWAMFLLKSIDLIGRIFIIQPSCGRTTASISCRFSQSLNFSFGKTKKLICSFAGGVLISLKVFSSSAVWSPSETALTNGPESLKRKRAGSVFAGIDTD